MSGSVDERVVRMEFDNSGFESGASKAIGILDKLNKALNMDGATDGLDNLKSAVGEFNMDSVSSSVEECSSKFSYFNAFVAGIFMDLGRRASSFAIDIGKKLTVQPLMDGFSEYQLQMNSIQTILSNAGDKLKEDGYDTQEKQIAIINERLDELNTYADKTIYNFSQMTRNIGTFTAAGVDLDTSVGAIQGIANLAAASGSTTQQASTAMYQLSQALASGTVKLQDWNSVVNAGMGGELFQNALKRTARAHGIAVDEIIAKQGSFRESLSEGWITAGILTETLNQMTISYDEVGDAAYEAARAQLLGSGYTEDDAKAILELAKNAEEAATKVRTWSQLWDTVGESLGSGWATTWRTIVGDFSEATDLFTFLSDRITGLIERSANARNELLNTWAAAGGRTALVDGIKFTVDAIYSIVENIGNAFSDVFGITAEQLWYLATGFGTFAEKLVPSQEAVQVLYDVFYDVFTVIHSGLGILGNFARIIANVAGFAWKLVQPIAYLAAIGFKNLLNVVAQASAHLHAFSDRVENSVSWVLRPLKKILDDLKVSFGNLSAGFMNVFGKRIQGITKSFTGLAEKFTLFSYISKTVQNATKKIVSFFTNIHETLVAFNKDEGVGYFENLFQPIENGIQKVENAFNALKSLLGNVKDWFLGVGDTDAISANFDKFAESAKTLGDVIYRHLPKPIQMVTDFIGNGLNLLGIETAVDRVSKSFSALEKSTRKVNDSEVTNPSRLQRFLNTISALKIGLTSLISKGFNKLPAPIQTFGRTIKSVGSTFLASVKNFVTGTKTFRNVKEFLAGFFKLDIFDSNINLTKRIEAIGNKIVEVFGNVKNYFSNFSFSQLFSDIGTGITGAFTTISNFLPKFDGFGSLGEKFKKIFSIDGDIFGNIMNSIPGTFSSLMDNISQTLGYGVENINKEAGKLSLDNATTNLGLLTDTFSEIPEKLTKSGGDVSTGMEKFISGFELPSLESISEKIPALLEGGIALSLIGFMRSLKNVNNTLSGVGKGIIDWPKNLGNALSQFGKGFNAWRQETKADMILKIALAMAILAGSLFLIASIPADDLIRAGQAMAIMAGSIVTLLMVLALLDKGLGALDTLAMANVGNAVKDLGIGVAAFTVACLLISAIPVGDLDRSISIVSQIAVSMALLSIAIGQNGKSIAKGSKGIITMAIGIYAMAKALEAIGQMDMDSIEKAMPMFIGIMLTLTIFGALGAKGIAELFKSVKSLAVGVALFAVAIVVLVSALSIASETLTLSAEMVGSLIILGAALAAFVAICKLLENTDPISVSLGLMAFSGAIAIMAAAFAVLGNVQNMDQAINGLTAIGIALLAFGALTQYVDPGDMMKTAASLIVFSVAIGALAAILYGISNIENFEQAIAGLKMMSIAMLLFGVMARFINADDLLKSGAAMLIFSASIAALGGAMLIFSNVDSSAMVTTLIAVVGMVGTLAIATAILSPFAGILVTVSSGILIFSAAVLVLSAGIWLLTDALNNLDGLDADTIAERIGSLGQGLGDLLVNLVGSIFESLASAITENQDKINGALMTIGGFIVEKFGELVTWAIENGPEFVQGLADGFMNNIGPIMDAGGQILDSIITAVGPIVEKLGELAIQAKDKFIEYITSDEFKAKATEIKDKMVEGLSSLKDKMVEIGTNAIEGLKEGIGNHIDSLTAKASEIVNSWVDTVKNFFGIHSPSTVMAEIGNNVLQGLIDGIGDGSLLSSLGEKATGLVTTIKDGLAGLPGKVVNVAGSAIGGFVNKVGSFFKPAQTNAAQVATGVETGVKAMPNTMSQKSAEAMKGFITGISASYARVKTATVAIVTHVNAALGVLANNMRAAAQKGGEGFVGGINAYRGSASNAGGNLRNAAVSAASGGYWGMHSAGSYLARGLADGINSSAYLAENAARRLEDAAEKAVKAKAKIKSPSRVFRELGGYIGEGFILGMQDWIQTSYDTGEELAGTVPDAFAETLSNMSLDIDDILDTDYNPVITPVIDPAEFNSGMSSIESMLNSNLNNISLGTANYSGEILGKLDNYADYNRQIADAVSASSLDYGLLGQAVASALISAGVHVEIDGGQLMGYLAGEIADARRMYS